MTKLNDAMTMSSSEDESGSDDTSDTEADQHDLKSIHTEAPVDQEQDNKQGGKGHWAIYYTSPQSLIITFSCSF